MRLGGEFESKSTRGRGTPYMPEQLSAGANGEGHEGFEFGYQIWPSSITNSILNCNYAGGNLDVMYIR